MSEKKKMIEERPVQTSPELKAIVGGGGALDPRPIATASTGNNTEKKGAGALDPRPASTPQPTPAPAPAPEPNTPSK